MYHALAGKMRTRDVQITLAALPAGGSTSEIAEINGQPSVVIRAGGRIISVIAIEMAGQQIHAVRVFANSEKLARI